MIKSPYATQLTLTGEASVKNGKPYRTKTQKKAAKAAAWRDDRGIWHSPAPVSYH